MFRPRRGLVTLVLTLATLALVVGAGARWISVQLLSTPHWTATSERLIENRDVRRAIASFTVRRALGASGIDAAIDHALPGAAAGTATGALHRAAGGASSAVLATGPGRRAWRRANRQAVRDLLVAADHPDRGQGLVLNLSPLLSDVVGAVAGTTVARAIPGSSQLLTVRDPSAGRLVVLSPAQLRSVSTFVRWIRTLAWALPLLALLLLVLGLISAAGWRLAALSAVGYRLLVAGGIVIGLRLLIEYGLAQLVVNSSTDRAAVRAAWMIGSSTLRTEGIWLLVGGAVVALASWAGRALTRSS